MSAAAALAFFALGTAFGIVVCLIVRAAGRKQT